MTKKAGDIFSRLTAADRVVVMTGKERFLLAEGARRLADVLQEAFGDVDQRTFDGEAAELSDVLDELRSYALIQHHKLVILDHADKFLAAGPKGQRRKSVEAYAAKPAPEATLLMRAEGWRPGRIDKLVTVIKCDLLKDAAAVRWCTNECGPRYGRTIDSHAATLLVERVGPGLARLDNEVAKLAAFVGAEHTISRQDVSELIGPGREEQAWALQLAIVSGSANAACVKMHELLEVSRLDKALVMWAISDLLRRLHMAARIVRQGESLHAYFKQLRLFGPEAKRMIEIAQRSEPSRLAKLLHLTVQTDQRNKSGIGDPLRNLEALTLQVTDTIGCL